MIAAILISIILTLLYYHLAMKPFLYWSDKKVRTGKIVPFFGDNFNMVLGSESCYEMIDRIYHTFPERRYIGAYIFTVPLLVLKSPELIKQICVKDFNYFQNHRSLVPDEIDELWGKTLFCLKGDEWKNMGSIMIPLFTSMKMRSIFERIRQNAKSFLDHFLKKNENIMEIEFKDAFGRYTADVIANIAFDLKIDSLSDRKNDIYVMGRVSNSLNSLYTRIVVFLYLMAPKITTKFGIPLVSHKLKTFFMETVNSTIRKREENNIERSDVLGILMDLKKNHSSGHVENFDERITTTGNEDCKIKKKLNQALTDIDIASQVFNYFLGGFETVSNSICFIAYELAVNNDIQKRLIKEIDGNRSKNGDISYEIIMKMTYMDMVVSEALRKWPVIVATDRVVTKPYTISPQLLDEDSVDLEQDVLICIPVMALHRDPKYYPEPTKFDPERFSPDNKKSIDPHTYLPFGLGPRDCIGRKLALLEIKTVIFYILSHFEIVPISKTEIPLKISKKSLNILPENGFHLGLKKRQ